MSDTDSLDFDKELSARVSQRATVRGIMDISRNLSLDALKNGLLEHSATLVPDAATLKSVVFSTPVNDRSEFIYEVGGRDVLLSYTKLGWTLRKV